MFTSPKPTDAQRQQLQVLVREMRAVAEPVGSMHAWWDPISDIEAFIEGKPTIVHMSADEWIHYATERLRLNADRGVR